MITEGGAKTRTTPVQVVLSDKTLRVLEMLQMWHGVGIGRIVECAIADMMPNYRAMIVNVAKAEGLPEGFDLSVFDLVDVPVPRADRRSGVVRMLGLSERLLVGAARRQGVRRR